MPWHGDAVARGQPLLGALPPCAAHRSSSPAAAASGGLAPQAGSTAPAATLTALLLGGRVGSRGETVPEQPTAGTRGVRQSWRCAAHLGHGTNIQAHNGNLPNARPAALGLTGHPLSLACESSTGSTAGPRSHPARRCPAAGRLSGGRAAVGGDAAERGWEGEGCRRRWWHSGTAGRCHSNTSCAAGPVGIGEGRGGDSAGHRPGVIPVPARRSERPRKWQHLEQVGMQEALSWSPFSPCIGPQQRQQQWHRGHGGRHAGPAWHQDTRNTALGLLGQEYPCTTKDGGHRTSPASLQGHRGAHGRGALGPGGRDAGCSGKEAACPATRCHASAPRGPCPCPGMVPSPPGRPRAPGLKPAAASAP